MQYQERKKIRQQRSRAVNQAMTQKLAKALEESLHELKHYATQQKSVATRTFPTAFPFMPDATNLLTPSYRHHMIQKQIQATENCLHHYSLMSSGRIGHFERQRLLDQKIAIENLITLLSRLEDRA